MLANYQQSILQQNPNEYAVRISVILCDQQSSIVLLAVRAPETEPVALAIRKVCFPFIVSGASLAEKTRGSQKYPAGTLASRFDLTF